MSNSPLGPAHASDEFAVGLGLAFAIHAIPAVMVGLTLAGYVSMRPTEHTFVRPPVVTAEILKLGDEARVFELPERKAPPRATKPDDTIVASENASNEPVERRDAGARPKNAREEDLLARFAEKSEAFAEKNAAPVGAVSDAGSPSGTGAPGAATGSSFGTTTDPAKVRAGAVYPAMLGEFFSNNWAIPSFLSPAEVANLVVKYRVTFDSSMRVVAVSDEPVKSSGNEFFDESAHNMLLKIRDQRLPPPPPPEDEAPTYRGKTVVINFRFKR